MKRYMLPISFIVIFLLPNMLFSFFRQNERIDQNRENEAKILQNHTQMISIEDGDQIFEMELEDYIVCVLLGEVPADFEPEAIQAQAIATRTYTLRRYLDRNKHDDAHVCTNASCCQAYVTEEIYLSNGHTEIQLNKIKDAVKKTSNQVLLYNGELIEATYFSCAGDKTENAVDVWGREVPYLRSVVSLGEEVSRNYQRTNVLTMKQFADKLGLSTMQNIQDRDVTVSYTQGGGIDSAEIAGRVYTGPELRTLLDLPSTAISFEIDDEVVHITTKGSGHRVGMSQYGAQAMACSGYTCEEILLHYYSGVKLCTFSDTQLKGVFDKDENL